MKKIVTIALMSMLSLAFVVPTVSHAQGAVSRGNVPWDTSTKIGKSDPRFNQERHIDEVIMKNTRFSVFTVALPLFKNRKDFRGICNRIGAGPGVYRDIRCFNTKDAWAVQVEQFTRQDYCFDSKGASRYTSGVLTSTTCP